MRLVLLGLRCKDECVAAYDAIPKGTVLIGSVLEGSGPFHYMSEAGVVCVTLAVSHRAAIRVVQTYLDKMIHEISPPRTCDDRRNSRKL